MWEFDPDYKDPYLGWEIEKGKFTKNILETIPHRKYTKDIKKTIEAAGESAKGTWTGYRDWTKNRTMGKDLPAVLAARKMIPQALTAGGEESMQSRRGLGSFTPWAQMGLSEEKYKSNLKQRQLDKGIGTNEELLQHNIGDTKNSALNQSSETPGDTTNRKPEPLVNKDQKLFSQTGDISFNTDSKITKGDIPEALREQLESGKTPEGIKPTDPKPTEKKPWTEGKLGKALATLAILGAHGDSAKQMGIANTFSKEDRSIPAYDPKASTKPKGSAWNLASLNLEDDIYGLG